MTYRTREDQFAAIVAEARRDSGLTAAEFDYQLNLGTELGATAYRGLGNALHRAGQARGRSEAEMADEFGAEIDAMVAAAKAKTYTGWSNVSRARGHKIRYAR